MGQITNAFRFFCLAIVPVCANFASAQDRNLNSQFDPIPLTDAALLWGSDVSHNLLRGVLAMEGFSNVLEVSIQSSQSFKNRRYRPDRYLVNFNFTATIENGETTCNAEVYFPKGYEFKTAIPRYRFKVKECRSIIF